ncbi:recombinase family protein [Paractinoplanes hotanensis]|uniref:Recombinase family protein n=1 Tax=Paractinoplanes hotanensis TaxID=2906497 RepID=A0ABT0YAR2_9ACTN|nr:recombinase family protein [Actinoplanes hotanensis]MCM4083136.1 recombinase family protein [Actinoplanes hotanensis]
MAPKLTSEALRPARHIQWIFTQRLAGISAAGIARTLNSLGVVPPSAHDRTPQPAPHRCRLDPAHGRGAAEHFISALRCPYKRAVADGLIAEGDNPVLALPPMRDRQRPHPCTHAASQPR